MGMRKTLLIVAGAVLLLVVAALVLRSVEVVAQGKLLAFTDHVRRVRVLDRFELYVGSEAKKPAPDAVNSALLTAIAAVSLVARSLLRRRSAGRRQPERFFLLSALAAAYLSLDEQLGIHETVGHNLCFLADLPGVNHPDDLIVAAFGLAGAAFAFFFRDVLFHSRRAAALFVAGATLFVLGALADLGLASELVEEWTEIASSAVLLWAFAVLAVDLVSSDVEPDANGGDGDEPVTGLTERVVTGT